MTRVRIPQPDAEEDVSAEQLASYALPNKGPPALRARLVATFETFSRREIVAWICKRAEEEERHPSAVLADIVGPARAASVGAYCEPWLFVAELRVRLSCKLPACDLMGCSAARGAGESE